MHLFTTLGFQLRAHLVTEKNKCVSKIILSFSISFWAYKNIGVLADFVTLSVEIPMNSGSTYI